MRTRFSLPTLTAAALLGAAPAIAQDTIKPQGEAKDTAAKAASVFSLNAPIVTQYFRPQDQRGINVFEATKDNAVPFTGFKLGFGAAFAQNFQGLKHENAAASRIVNTVEQNSLMKI